MPLSDKFDLLETLFSASTSLCCKQQCLSHSVAQHLLYQNRSHLTFKENDNSVIYKVKQFFKICALLSQSQVGKTDNGGALYISRNCTFTCQFDASWFVINVSLEMQSMLVYYYTSSKTNIIKFIKKFSSGYTNNAVDYQHPVLPTMQPNSKCLTFPLHY